MLKYYMLVHQLNLLQVRLKQAEAGAIHAKEASKFFLAYLDIETKAEKIALNYAA